MVAEVVEAAAVAVEGSAAAAVVVAETIDLRWVAAVAAELGSVEAKAAAVVVGEPVVVEVAAAVVGAATECSRHQSHTNRSRHQPGM